MSGIESKIKKVSEDIDTALNEFKSIQKTFTTYDERINNLTLKLPQLENEFNEIKESIADSISNLENKFQYIQKSIEKTQNDLIINKKSDNKLKDDIEFLKGNIEDFSSKIQSISSLEEKENKLQDLIQKLSVELSLVKESQTSTNNYLLDIQGKLNDLNSQTSSISQNVSEIEGKLQEEEKSDETAKKMEGIINRIKNIEQEVGITSGELIATGFDNFNVLKKFTSDTLGTESIKSIFPFEEAKDPIEVLKSVKKLIREVSSMDETDIPDISDILIRYSDRTGTSDRRSLFINYTKDVRRALELGQSILMSIGIKRGQTRRMIEEAKTIVGKWAREEDILGDGGMKTVFEMLEVLENDFQE